VPPCRAIDHICCPIARIMSPRPARGINAEKQIFIRI
jgi:hypothetical protein